MVNFEPRIGKSFQHFGSPPFFIEIVPPKLNAQTHRFEQHCRYLEELFARTDVSGINIPEIQDESKKGERGKRRNEYRERIPPREYARDLSEEFDTEFIVNRVIVQDSEPVQEEWLLETHEDYGVSAITVIGGESSSSICEREDSIESISASILAIDSMMSLNSE